MEEFQPTQKRNPKTCPPPAGTKIILHGTGGWGVWAMEGFRKNYKKKQDFKTLMDGETCYRFVDKDGDNVNYVEYWSYE